MRKIAREAVIVCLLGAAIGSAYAFAQEYGNFRRETAQWAAMSPQEQGLNMRFEPKMNIVDALGGAVAGFFVGFAVWGVYRLVRFAILG